MLIISEESDYSAQAVATELSIRDVPCRRWDISEFPQHMRFAAELNAEADPRWQATTQGQHAELELHKVSAVYYRRPRDFELPPSLSGPERRFAHAQARIGVGGVVTSLSARWINHPSALADAEQKPRQLAQLADCGLATPPSLITNDPLAVRDFAARVGGDLIVKPLAEPIVWEGGGETVVYTRRLTTMDLDALDGVESTAHYFQQWQEKQFEVRLTAVGNQLFAVAIHAGSTESYIDWRTDYDSLWYEVIEPPEHVRRGVAHYLDRAGLTYAAFDFVVRPEGTWVVLEANAAGQWGWLAEECDLPIAAAIADELTRDGTYQG